MLELRRNKLALSIEMDVHWTRDLEVIIHDSAAGRVFGTELAVAVLDVEEYSREVAERGQGVNTGFASSRFCLDRELGRGVDWIFSNHAAEMAAIRGALLRRR